MILEKAFRPEAYEPRIGQLWDEAGIFRADPSSGKPPFSLVIPPPNVTGTLHIGHALDYTLQDILVRWHRMKGDDACWVPGSDHAGIATQMVVERHLREQGTTRHELGRERFLEKVWEWKQVYRDRIMATLRRLGCSCDWSRERFTLDPGFSRAVRETFVRLYDEGLIYRDKRLINWCPSCLTALSDLEVDRDDPEEGEMWSFAYPLEGGGEIVVATTRPETMLGDTAVAVHPADPRWRDAIGRRVLHPFFPGREIRVIADDILADPETGTGAVKVTPAHDPNDFACGRRHGLPEISIFDEHGRVNEQGGPFAGMDRFEAREAVKQALAERGLARGARKHRYAPGRCQRCRTIVEPMVSTQWFVRAKPLAEPALAAVREGRIRFVPRSWEKTYFHWLENIQDWCISRQLWWGHRIPAWYCAECDHVTVAREDPDRCAACGSPRIEQDPDVLDTWFSSGLWPFGVFGWPEETDDLRRYYPTSVLVTGFDIIFFWVARMIMAGLHLTGEVPFRTVLFHGLVRDSRGRKMSKSRGNAVDPNRAMDEHGVDAVRFTLAALASPGSDLALAEERLAGYRAFMNKIWNATRFLLMKVPGREDPRSRWSPDELDDLDRWLLAEWEDTVAAAEEGMKGFRFDHVAERVYHFLWHSFCDWALEWSKPDLAGDAEGNRARVRLAVLLDVLDGALRLLHPIAPFITEELWQHLPRRQDDPAFLATAPWPTTGIAPADAGVARERVRELLLEPVVAVRALRAAAGIPPGRRIPVLLRPRREGVATILSRLAPRIALLAQADRVEQVDVPPEGPRLRRVLDAVEVILPLAGTIDVEAERRRLAREEQKLARDLAAVERKLANEGFLAKAPPAVVEKERGRRAVLSERLAEVRSILEQLEEA